MITIVTLGRIRRACEEGLTMVETARRLELPYHTVVYWAHRLGLPFGRRPRQYKPRLRPPRVVTPAQYQAAEAQLRATLQGLRAYGPR